MINASEIVIDDEFEKLIPPLTQDEWTQLCANVERDGFRDPVVVWLGHELLVDGHNRMRIWRDAYGSDPDKAPDIIEKAFKDRTEVKCWIARNQLGRRNINDAQRVQLVRILEPELKKQAKENQQERKGKQVGASIQNSGDLPNQIRVDKELAKLAGVSHDTVSKASKVLDKATPELAQAMLENKVSINTAAKAADLPPEKQAEVVKAAKQSESPRKAASTALKTVATVTTESVPARKWHVSDDCSKIRALFEKLYDNWKEEADKVAIRQLFRQLANEV